MAALNLHLRYDEIDDLMHVCDKGGDGKVSYDEFISQMDLNMRDRAGEVQEKVEEAFFEAIGQALEDSPEPLEDLMREHDFEHDGTIDARDLPSVLKRLSVMNPEPHLPTLLKAARLGPNDKKIDYQAFSASLEAEVAKRRRQSSAIHERMLQKLAALLRARDTSFFEFFIMLDVNQSSTISKIEFKTGLQSLGLNATPEEFECLWSTIYTPLRQLHQAEA